MMDNSGAVLLLKGFLTIIIGTALSIFINGCLNNICNEKKLSKGLKITLNVSFALGLLLYYALWMCTLLENSIVETVVSIFYIINEILYFILELIIICSRDMSEEPKDSAKSRKTDTLLCLFLGWTGAHRYYEGKIVTGILYSTVVFINILFFTGLLFHINLFHGDDVEIAIFWYFGNIAWLICILSDFCKVLSGKSCDKKGNPITRWNPLSVTQQVQNEETEQPETEVTE